MLHEQILRITQRPAEISVSDQLGDLNAINPAQKGFCFIEAPHLN